MTAVGCAVRLLTMCGQALPLLLFNFFFLFFFLLASLLDSLFLLLSPRGIRLRRSSAFDMRPVSSAGHMWTRNARFTSCRLD